MVRKIVRKVEVIWMVIERQDISFVWLRDNKDPDFLRKFNRSTLEVIPWSFDGGIKYALGKSYDIDTLWREYQVAVGDIEENKQ